MPAAPEPLASTSKFVEHRETREPRPDASRKVSLGSMSRRDCPRCQEREALFAGSVCMACGADLSKPKGRAKRLPRALTVSKTRATLRTPVVEDAGNLLALMGAKA